MKLIQSKKLYKEAVKYLVGGVNSPVRAFKAVGGHPVFIQKGRGSKIYDVDGNQYIDYVMSWGPLILGHAAPVIIKSVKNTLNFGTSFGAPTKMEIELSKIICKAIPSIEMLRLVNSGTEATMSAIRLSRAYATRLRRAGRAWTGKDKIIKFAGCYHGHYDGLLIKAGSGSATFGVPDSLGVPKSFSKGTIVCPYNDIDRVSRIIKQRHKEIACVLVEPIAANMGVVLPKKHFLEDLRELTSKYNIILIFDEVITGFRVCFGGVQNIYNIKPDLTCLGKIIGGGLPIGAYGGRKEIMENLSPLGGVYQAGTLSGNPLAVSAGLAVLKTLSRMNYQTLNKKTEILCQKLAEELKRKKIKFYLNRAGSMWTIFFTDKEVYDFDTAKTSDISKYAIYFWNMLKQGIYLPPSQFEANFLSFAHTGNDIKTTLEAHKKAILKMK